MKKLILGTAGHIDHGKTSMVKLLTGTDTDRLKEEKARGITIELGFAHIDFSNDIHIGIIDVPGHEKFVKTMVSGAGGIDFVCLIIAADEGVMPQTREHFDICKLLQVRHGLIALSKVDMVDPDWLELVTDDIRQFVQGTFLENAPIIPFSSTTGENREKLLDAIEQIAVEVEPREATDIFRLPVDRAFTMKGFGTVITGSCLGGKIEVGETLQILPSGTLAKVRGLQVHNETVEKAGAGLRTAVNFQGLEKNEVNRGDVLIKPGSLPTTYLVDAHVDMLKSNTKPIKHRARVRFHHKTSEMPARLIPLAGKEIKPGNSAYIQLRLEAPTVAVSGDRFILRSYSPVTTIGGGIILNPHPRKHKAPYENALEDLRVMETGTIDQKMLLLYQGAGKTGLPFSTLPALCGATVNTLLPIYRKFLSQGVLVRYDQEKEIAVSKETFNHLSTATLDYLEQFHEDNSAVEGVNNKVLADKVDWGVQTKLLARILAGLEKSQKIKRKDDLVSIFDHKAQLKGEMEAFGKNILEAISNGKVTPPTLKELVELAGNDKKQALGVLDLLLAENKIVRVSETLYYDKSTLSELTGKLLESLEKNESIDAKQFKDLTKTSRKYAIPLLEYFDVARVTLRVGDKRTARKTVGK